MHYLFVLYLTIEIENAPSFTHRLIQYSVLYCKAGVNLVGVVTTRLTSKLVGLGPGTLGQVFTQGYLRQ